SEAMDPTSVTSTTFELRDSLGNLVPAAVTYDMASLTASLDPSSPLAFSTTFTARIKGGPGGVRDLAGNSLAADFPWTFTSAAAPPPPPDQGPGGPILVVSGPNAFSRYYAEILRTEGLNEFDVKDISTVTAATLGNYDVVILGDFALTAAQVTMFNNWVTGGGNLIAMHPDKQLAGLLGLTDAGATLSNAYLSINTNVPPGAGIVGST